MTLKEFNKFTIHFATINTLEYVNMKLKETGFTIHFATINTFSCTILFSNHQNLQYTLLLLIRGINNDIKGI